MVVMLKNKELFFCVRVFRFLALFERVRVHVSGIVDDVCMGK